MGLWILPLGLVTGSPTGVWAHLFLYRFRSKNRAAGPMVVGTRRLASAPHASGAGQTIWRQEATAVIHEGIAVPQEPAVRDALVADVTDHVLRTLRERAERRDVLMLPQRERIGRWRIALAVTVGVGLCLPWSARSQPMPPAQPERVEIVGDYRYAYHDPMSLAEAQHVAYTEAVRMAVDRSRPFLDGTVSVTDQALLNQVRQILASGYLQDLQVLEQADKDRTVYAKVRATINLQEVTAVIKREINRGQGTASPGLDQNRALKILSVREEKDGTVAVVFKALQRLDWLTTAYDGSLREHADVMIDFYDDHGVPIGSDRFPARKAAPGEVLNPGQIGVQTFSKPPRTRSYQAWLVQ